MNESNAREPDDDLRVAPWHAFDGPQRLKPLHSPMAMFLVLLFFSLFWNGISWTGFVLTIRDGVWFFSIFLLLFVGIGALMIWGTIYQAMQLFNPKVSIAMSNGAVVPGDTVDIAWEIATNASQLQQLELSMIGEEVVTYRRGTSTTTDRSIFQKIPIATVTTESEMRFGSTTVTLPSPMIHSFVAPNNEIRWSIEVVCKIRWWPDVYQKMPFAVCPTPVHQEGYTEEEESSL